MGALIPCIWLDTAAEAAAAFYIEAFGGGRVVATSRYPESGENPSGKPPGSVLTVEFEVAGQRFTALNGGPIFVLNPSVSFFVNLKSRAEVERLYAALVDGGKALMAIGTYPWSERYGWVMDRFGVSWQVMLSANPDVATIVPCLMFAGPNHRRAEEAMRFYTEVFPRSRVDAIERYAPGDGAGEAGVGTVKHGRVVLDGQWMVAMDAHGPHDIVFNEALSLQVMCKDQAELDRFWEALSEGGAKSACGWLKDRFGLSWQVVPERIAAWMSSKDAAARDRAFAAMLTMTKLDIAALDRAFAGA
jgi:predicted 3-demethylubiquinone-9 3-methyltransferase (glyoxalase superfamily)